MSKQNNLVTTEDIKRYRVINEPNDNDIRRALDKNERTKREENILLQTTQSLCPLGKKIEKKGTNLDQVTLARFGKSQFYSHAAMQAISCALEYIPFYSEDDIVQNMRVHQWFKDLRQIGAPSVEGVALNTSFGDQKNAFVIKAPQSAKFDNLSHEIFIAMFGLNQIRKFIPNFAYVFGGFRCSLPYVDEKTKKVISWCNQTGPQVTYAIYENIFPSVSLADYIKTCSGQEFFNIYFQVLLGLWTAEKVTGFTHYDLHSENILVRDPGFDSFQITYQLGDDTLFVKTKKIGTLIDYGFSHIKYKDTHYGRAGLEFGSVFSDKSFIMQDAYKLLMFSAQDAFIHENKSVVNVISKIYTFFSSGNLFNAVKEQSKLFYALPYNKRTKNIKLSDFIYYTLQVVLPKNVNAKEFDLPHLNCENMCLQESEYLSRSGINGEIKSKDIFDLFQNFVSIGDKKLLKQFDLNFDQNWENSLPRIEKTLKEGRKNLSEMKILDLSRMRPEQIFNVNTMELYKSFIYNIIASKASWSEIYNLINIIIFMDKYFDRIEIKSYLQKADLLLEELRLGINQLVEVEDKNVFHLNSLIPVEGQKYISRDKRLFWFIEKWPTFNF